MRNASQFIRLGQLGLVISLFTVGSLSADVLQWRTRVPSGVANPNSIGSYVNTFEMGNGGTTGYDSGLDIDLDTSITPNNQFFVNYTSLGGNKVEYDFTPYPQVGDTYKSYLSFENRVGGSVSVANTIDFLSMDLTNNPNGVNDFAYSLQLDTNNSGSYDTIRTGTVSSILGQVKQELPSWNQTIASVQDHSTGFYYGELTLTAMGAQAPQHVSFDWAIVGNPGNAGELSGSGAGGAGPDVIAGSVGHAYNISKHEVTAGQYTQFLNAVAASDPHGLYDAAMTSDYGCKIVRSGTDGSYNYSVALDWKNRPVNYVSYFDAMRFVNWIENGQPIGAQGPSTTEDGTYLISDGISEVRSPEATFFLPSEDEWYKAAYHKNDGATGNYIDYPTGSDSIPSNDLISPDPGNNANFRQGGLTIDAPYYTTEVGEFENSESPYGTFDQGGNVHEWNEEVFNGVHRGMRGGSFGTTVSPMQAAHRGYRYPPSAQYWLGFRVASIPEPTADFDGDGDIDGSDFLKWQRGESPNPMSTEDLALWKSQFGTTPALSAATTVPEPGSCLLLALLGFTSTMSGMPRIR